MTEKKKLFEFKEGVVIPVFGTSRVYSNHNLTDAIALTLLRENPNRKVLFSRLPRDLKARLKEKPSSVSQAQPKTKKPASRSKAKVLKKVPAQPEEVKAAPAKKMPVQSGKLKALKKDGPTVEKVKGSKA